MRKFLSAESAVKACSYRNCFLIDMQRTWQTVTEKMRKIVSYVCVSVRACARNGRAFVTSTQSRSKFMIYKSDKAIFLLQIVDTH